MDRQLDIIATNPGTFTIPRHVAGRLTAQDFIYFHWPASFDPSRYTVAVESLDTAGPPFRGISKLKKTVELPHVMYGWHVRVGVLPDSDRLPAFEAELGRASTYIIPETGRANGRFQMERHGGYTSMGI